MNDTSTKSMDTSEVEVDDAGGAKVQLKETMKQLEQQRNLC